VAFHELEIKRIEKAVEAFMKKRRPPSHIRSKLDLGFQIKGHSVELFTIRPAWDDPKIIRHHPFAKTTFVRSTNTWKIFWQRRDLKWHGYAPDPYVQSFAEFLEVVDRDDHACFFG
jgi:Protein of unknown function (DUF3024)